MTDRKKKLEILYINDILILNNRIFSDKTNHYLKKMLFNLRLVFRYNDEGVDDLIDLYYYIEDILKNEIEVDDEELTILIYRLTDTVLNMDDNLHAGTLIMESAANLLQSLYLEFETYKLADRVYEYPEDKEYILSQMKNQVVDFDNLIEILNITSDVQVKERVEKILENNYPFEYATYKARCEYLDV